MRRTPSNRSSEETTPDRWAQVTEVVDGAMRRPDPADRAAFLRQACGDDRQLRRQVEELLRFEDAESGILAGPILGDRLVGTDDTTEPLPRFPVALAAGQKVGPYRIERLIGRGGMGTVALAHDEELERRVALKVIRRDRLSAEALQRFDLERRVLARMEHPAIASIFDSGWLAGDSLSPDDSQGMPYFTMEYVEGEPIDVYCDRQQLSIDARLALVLEISEALDEAHRHLVVHRDLKPTNILVTTEGRPKLLDFGIAKQLEAVTGTSSAPPGVAAVTRTGHQPMTLPWASPEQVRGLPIGVATDIYSLGLLTYRLLCGHPAYLLDGDYFENIRRICEQVPPAPSSRVGLIFDEWQDGAPKPVKPAEVAMARGTDPHALRRKLRGDLDAIVAKALAKDPDQRYRSAEALAGDTRRHLDGLPVEARSATITYRLGKFARRHQLGLAAAFLVIASLTLGTIAWFDGQRQVEAEREQRQEAAEQAQQAERQAEALTGFARSLVLSTDPDASANQPMTPEQILERGEREARRRLDGEPEMLAHQIEALGLAYHGLGKIDAAHRLFGESLELRREVYGVGDHPLVARALNNFAATANRSGDRRLAERLYRLALAMKQRLGQDPDDLARVETNLASLLASRGELAEAERHYRNLLEVRRNDPENDPRELASSLRSLGNLLYLDSRFDEAEPALKEALELRQKHDGEDSIRTADVWSSLGRVYQGQGKLDQAEDALERALSIRQARLGNEHLHVALSRKDLASLLFELGESSAAEPLWAEAMAVLRAKKPSGSWELADADSQQGERLAAAGRMDEALPLLQESYRILRAMRGEESLYARRARGRLEAALRQIP